MAVANITMNFVPPIYPIPNHTMTNFDAFSTGQTSCDDSETESNFTSDEFDSEGLDDIGQDPFPPCVSIDPEPDIAGQLLHFAEMVNKDIQKFFGKRKAVDDIDDDIGSNCKDRLASGKSGRELYYADLLKVAQQGDNLDSNNEPKRKSDRIIISNSDEHRDKKLGPLRELFDFALSTSRPNAMNTKWSEDKGIPGRQDVIIPWRKRTLPSSFFLEPQTERRTGLTQDPPDFSDLMAAAADD